MEFEEGVQYHLRVKKGDVARYVLLPGDPGRLEIITSFWESSTLVASHRGFMTYKGTYKGVDISAVNTGIGSPSTAIVLEELLRVGADTFIRVGTSGGISPDLRVGDLVISTGAVRLEGTTKQYVVPEYPAVASYEVVLALIEAAETLGVRYKVGITATTDSFFTGQGRPGHNNYMQSWMRDLIINLQYSRVLNFEMEAATLFVLSSIYGARAGAVCSIVADRVKNKIVPEAGVRDAVHVANEAVKILSEWDEVKKNRGREYYYPSISKR